MKLILAPIADVCDIAFRILCRKYGADLVFTGMASANALAHKDTKSMSIIKTVKKEKPVAVQLVGGNIENLVKASRMIHADYLDINLGCPDKKVIRLGGGSSLLNNFDKVHKIINSLTHSTKIPITAKIRVFKDMDKTIQLAKTIEKAGARFITVHARTPKQGFDKQSDWTYIKAIKSSVSIPVIGNGDIRTRQDYLNMLEQTGCDAVMIGRAAIGNPGVFSEIRGKSAPDKITMLNRYLKLAAKYDIHINTIKKQAQWFSKGIKQASTARRLLSKSKTAAEVGEIINSLRITS